MITYQPEQRRRIGEQYKQRLCQALSAIAAALYYYYYYSFVSYQFVTFLSNVIHSIPRDVRILLRC
jgi:ferritin-like protein